uniref:ATP synthase F0 subunit 8 n=1 Tax=Cucujoidea sp. 22 KM-2017 TaxID=2219359 RepID=A0A346RI86_9CUCU|nr:ATP synthase F0 subunit 8 [Cucujoidea sp. 22 KM-2017]
MPQMMPLLWINLFTFFILIYLYILINLYFFNNKTMKINLLINKSPKSFMNWKW